MGQHDVVRGDVGAGRLLLLWRDQHAVRLHDLVNEKAFKSKLAGNEVYYTIL